MKKALAGILITLIIFTGINLSNAENEIPNVQLEMRNYDAIVLPEGTFIPAINLQGISTETCPEGYKVKFQGTDDLYINETNVIPHGTYFYGYIEKINEPVIGTNAAMKIKITKLVFQDGFEIPIKGYLYNSNNNTFGGELTEPSEYVRMPHYQSKFQGISWNHRGATLQIRPGGRRSMGRHTSINSGERLIIVLTAPAEITHIIQD